jgi:plastocyanin
MKTVKNLIFGIFLVAFTFAANAQKNVVKTVSLEQTKGEFTQKALTLSPGDYVFEIANNGIDHEVGFVLAPEGKTDQANHIKNAYVTSTVKTDSKSTSKKVTLKKGKYTYFCPLNPTPQYTLVVE